MFAERAGVITEGSCSEAMQKADELGRMLGALIKSVGKKAG